MKRKSLYALIICELFLMTGILVSCDNAAELINGLNNKTPEEQTKTGIELTVTVPPKAIEYGVYRFETDKYSDGEIKTNLKNPEYEIFVLNNTTDKPVTKTFKDYYGLKKGQSYTYVVTDVDGNEITRIIKTAEADGWQYPVLSVPPAASFDGNKLTFTTKPVISYKNGENYVFSLSILYHLGVYYDTESSISYEELPPYTFFITYNSITKQTSYDIPNNSRGYEIPLKKYSFYIWLENEINEDTGIVYLPHFKTIPDGNLPAKICGEKKDPQTPDTEPGIKLELTIPANTEQYAVYRFETGKFADDDNSWWNEKYLYYYLICINPSHEVV